ncbi:conserved hypothetical protein [Hyella patelloides LEGE 07179]|uniref:Resolvase HTH domain-containing protein n=1 Tax=Hyella patelloides LEGE 07179 TaxID=945734 RepID=A0A563VIU8_9CYAN|nr:hypothetical protein [Hyella patelloides]VEP11311.1 conserved hypothetical protein [Hyella patelloides LEGE 07179]
MEEQLKEAILSVCNYDSNSLQRQKNLNRLLILIQQLPGIYRSSHQDYPEAYNRTLIWVSKNIDRFEAQTESIQQSFVIWINGYLKWRIRDLYVSDNRYDPQRVYPSSNEKTGIDLIENISDPRFSLSLLDTQIAEIQAEKEVRLGNAIADYIKQDSNKNLSQTHPRKYPKCNCQCLAIRLLLQQPPAKISEIARELKVNNQTLYSHWKQKCLPLLQEIGEELGGNGQS